MRLYLFSSLNNSLRSWFESMRSCSRLLVQCCTHVCWPAAVRLIMRTLFLIYSRAYLMNLSFCMKHSNIKLPYCDTLSVLDTDCRPVYLEPLHPRASTFHTCHTAWPFVLALLPFLISHRRPQVLRLSVSFWASTFLKSYLGRDLQVVIPERDYK